MDTTRWKSVLVPREVYDEIRAISKSEGRTISGQLRLMFDVLQELSLSQTLQPRRIRAETPYVFFHHCCMG